LAQVRFVFLRVQNTCVKGGKIAVWDTSDLTLEDRCQNLRMPIGRSRTRPTEINTLVDLIAQLVGDLIGIDSPPLGLMSWVVTTMGNFHAELV
jgi:hypothetical protein